MMEYGIKLGHDKDAIDATGDLIRDILSAPTGDKSKIAAFKAMTHCLAIQNATISDVHIDGSEHTHVPPIDWDAAARAFGFAEEEPEEDTEE